MTAEDRAREVAAKHWQRGSAQHKVLTELITAAITAAVEEERRRLIPLVCDTCAEGYQPERSDDTGYWFHRHYCPASPIYESIREEGMG